MIKATYPFTFDHLAGNILSFRLQGSQVVAKLCVLEEDLFRVMIQPSDSLALPNTWLVAPGMADVPFEGRNRMDLSPFSLPGFTHTLNEEEVVVETDCLQVRIQLDGFKCHWHRKQNGDTVHLLSDRPTQAYNFEGELGQGVYHYKARKRHEAYYGLGEKTGDTNRYGHSYRMVSVDPMGYDAKSSDPLYKHIPFYITRDTQTKASYGLFYDTLSSAVFDMGREIDNYHGPYRYMSAQAHELDYYFIGGDSVGAITERYSWLTGQTMMQPRWSLGYSGSTMTYTDAPNAQELLQEFLDLCEQHDIICDSFQMSSGYTSIGHKRYVFNWNQDKFPTPKAFAQSYADKGVKLCANIKPALLRDHPLFEELRERGLFIHNQQGEVEMVQFWDEIGAYIDFTNPAAFDWWKAQVTAQLLAYGIESTWNDNNEYEIWSGSALVHGFGTAQPFELTRALQPLLMMKASYEAQKSYAPQLRPYLISRSGCPGMQRYVQTWSGDNYTAWESLQYNIKMAIGLSLSGVYNLGHDVGGFAGPQPDPELFLRWVQNGIFYPRFTIHSWNDDQTVNVPWMHPSVADLIGQLIKFRHRLTPFFYTAVYNAHAYYTPIIKPTFYNYEHDERTFAENDEFLVGDVLLVASVVQPGQRERTLYLPDEPDGWIDYHTGKWYAGAQVVTLSAPLTYALFLVKGGSIIPVNSATVGFTTKHLDERSFELFPHPITGETTYTLYEDDGVGADFATHHLKITLRLVTNADKIEVFTTQVGNYTPTYRQGRFSLPVGEQRPLYVNGVLQSTLKPTS